MIKKLLLLLLAVVALESSAQLAVGSWRHYPVYSNDVSKVIDTPSRVYFLNSGFLYGYDKKADESLSFDRSNILSDVAVKSIFYDKKGHRLAIAYDNGNIDLLYDDGNLVNLPDIKDATLATAPVINHIAFNGDDIFVATNFGLVIYDGKRLEVRESGIYNRNIDFVIPLGSHIAVISGQEHYTIPRDRKINKFDNFTRQLTQANFSYVIPDDKTDNVYYATIYGVLARMEVNKETGAISRTNNGALGTVSTSGFFDSDDYIYFANVDGDIRAAEKGTSSISQKIVGHLPEIISGDIVATCKGLSNVWAAGSLGLGQYDIADGSVTVLNDRMRPSGASTVVKPAFFFPTTDKSGFYVQNLGRSQFRPAGNGEGTTLVQLVDKYEDGAFHSVAPDNVEAKMYWSIDTQNKKGKYIINPTSLVEDPDDPTKIFMGSGTEGVYVIKDGEQIGKFDKDNSPLPSMANAGERVLSLQIDKKGNLWVGLQDYENYLFVLPSAKRKADPSTVKREDWINATPQKMLSNKDLTVMTCERSNIVLTYVTHNTLQVIDTRGTYDNFNDDQSKNYTSFTDQDGKSFWPEVPFCMVEDHDGKVWVGTTEGIIEFTRPANMLSADFRINRLKVPRNDGTNLADYLLEKENINGISVDSSNRKWVATDASGVYLVSPNGDEILEHFTAENSMLPSNQVFCVYAHPMSNSVFFGTPYGISEYSSTSSPSRPDYSDVYAYPNPVTPDYTGWITITGLMSDSRVKICDSAMQVIYETRSEGGMATWDGCNFSGARVKSGVYYVLASTGADASDSAADVVAKILIVN